MISLTSTQEAQDQGYQAESGVVTNPHGDPGLGGRRASPGFCCKSAWLDGQAETLDLSLVTLPSPAPHNLQPFKPNLNLLTPPHLFIPSETTMKILACILPSSFYFLCGTCCIFSLQRPRSVNSLHDNHFYARILPYMIRTTQVPDFTSQYELC